MTDGKTQLTGLIGWPVEHSFSPAMHNSAFDALGLNWYYVPLPVRPGQVAAAVKGLVALGFRGANVTVPHKQAVMPHLDEITDTARAIGAVNTIVVERGRLIGHNTDGSGFIAALRDEGFEPSGKHALVLGAGGAARAITYSLAKTECAVTIHNRTADRAKELAQHLESSGMGALVAWVQPASRLSDLDLGQFDLLVNATSVGMWPHTDVSPWPGTLSVPSGWTVYDLVFNPAETLLLAQARATGAAAISGLGMLVRQGSIAFEMWTSKPPPVDLMRSACEQALSGHQKNLTKAG